MAITPPQSRHSGYVNQQQMNHAPAARALFGLRLILLALIPALCLASITGCGSSGFTGTITSLSASSVILDSGQSFSVAATVTGRPAITWSLSSTQCSDSACGTLSDTTGETIIYTAPAGLTSQLQLTLTATVTGSSSSSSVSITVNPSPSISGTPAAGVVGTVYSTTLQAVGGSAPYTWSIASGALPAGLTLSPTTGVISGTPTSSGTFSFTVQVVDSSIVPITITATESIVISPAPPPALTIVTSSAPNATAGMAYSVALQATGGVTPYTWSILTGSLPAGLSLSATTGIISGTPTTPGTSSFTIQVQDASGATASAAFSIVVNAAPVTLSISGTLPNATVGTLYSGTIGVSGGAAPYNCSITTGMLPTGLALSGCTISGTPTASGTTTLTIHASDSSNPANTGSGTVTLVINPAPVTLTVSATLPTATVGSIYSGTIGVSGGSAPYLCSITTGTLPAGLALSGCTISGTPTTSGITTLTIRASDSASPANTGSGTVTLTIDPAPGALTLTSPPNATVGTAYSGTIGVTGGTAPYTCSIASGTLPAGLALSGCVISGTPTVSGTSTLTIDATDSAVPPNSGSGTVTLNINPAPATLTLTSPPNATAGSPYSGDIGVSGGTAPYSCSIASGTLPTGLTLSGCTISGTPVTSGTTTLTINAIDSATPPDTGSATITFTINPAPGALTITPPPNATAGTAYSGDIGVSGGTAPYTCSIASGTLPAGLTLSGCTISGTPTTSGTTTLTIDATDAATPPDTGSASITFTINPAPGALTITPPPNATAGAAYSGDIGVSGGTAPYICSISSGTLPAGLTLSGCTISGTPTTSGTTTLTIDATDSATPPDTGSATITFTINPAPAMLTITSPPAASDGSPYTGTIGISGGTAPYTCTITSGTLPAGLTLSGCVITGTPTAPGTTTLTIQVSDSSIPPNTASSTITVTVNPPGATLTITSPPAATVGTAYSGTIGVTGGTAPYTCTITSGTLPAGLSLNGCILSGTPTTGGNTTLTIEATDSATPANTGSGSITLTINPAPITLVITSPPTAVVGDLYSGTIGVTGGTAPYTCSITAGTLPIGLALIGCTISGIPISAGTTTLTIQAADSATPANTGSGSITLTINVSATLTITSPPAATVGTAYSGTIGVTGGTAPYTCTITSGTLPAGLSLTGCTLTGTPTTSGTSTLTIHVADSATPANTGSSTVTLTINPAPVTLTITPPAAATVGTSYSGTIGVSGGTAPYICSITAGTLPAGLSLTGCTISGTPTVAGTASLTVHASDSSSPANTGSATFTFTINPAPVTLIITPPPTATAGTPYTGTIGVSGGTAPYNCSITAGTLPTGLTLSGCTLSGTPTTSGTSTVTIQATDSSSPANINSASISITVNPPAATLTITSPPALTIGVAYSGTIGISGGTAPYTCSITAGTLPTGLTLTGCIITGTATATGTTTLTIHVTDSAIPANTASGNVTITVSPVPNLVLTGSLPNATLNLAYTQTLNATGGLPTYTYAVTSGTLPAGLNLSSAGVLSGTPTSPGASSFTVTVTDTESTPQTASLLIVLLVAYPATANDTELTGPYAYIFQGYDDVASGVLAYQTSTVGSFTADGAGLITNGELDANHQTSSPAGTTVATGTFLGTYQVGTDNRGTITLTTLNSDGTTGSTYTYAVALKAPVFPATISIQADLIEFDDDGLQGTRGSGTLLAQQTSAFSAGLNGSYAFGLQGDTPCLPTCSIGIIAGPAAAVGQFTASGSGVISSGTGDANIATTTFASAPLSGSYGATDGNGRLQLTLSTAGTPAGVYPSDYAVYIVNSQQAFLISTDKHSAYILLSGSAHLQSQTTFSNASMNAPFIGYENSASNPGLLGATLSNTLALSTASVFRTTANAAGTCNFTSVDTGGVTGLVNGLAGLASAAPILNALLGTFESTGTAACTVSADGRGVLNYPPPSGILATTLGLLGLPTGAPLPRVFYLIAPNQGYFLETSYAGLGSFEPQTGGPFSTASLDGTFVYGTAPAASLVSLNSSGIITADGAGDATSTLDLNLGLGTVNVLQAGATQAGTYTAPNATTGRFTLNGTVVVYAISPSRYVLLDTSAAATSPSVALIY